MANNYTRMDFAAFKKNLSEGKYKVAVGAKRALGKSGLTDEEKSKAGKLIASHFGVEATPVKAPKAAKSTATKAAAPKAAKSAATPKTAAPAKSAGKGTRLAATPDFNTLLNESHSISNGVCRNLASLKDLSTHFNLDLSAEVARAVSVLDRSTTLLDISVNLMEKKHGLASSKPSTASIDMDEDTVDISDAGGDEDEGPSNGASIAGGLPFRGQTVFENSAS